MKKKEMLLFYCVRVGRVLNPVAEVSWVKKYYEKTIAQVRLPPLWRPAFCCRTRRWSVVLRPLSSGPDSDPAPPRLQLIHAKRP
ncbi:Lysine-specific demethylase 5B-B [Trichinella spiralis]|uniref:Lysine-specific demethylase 5B-B n=1 Tax=Trichinella spiralis TaxID=6334 RepID=A0ABR3L248_TRISP